MMQDPRIDRRPLYAQAYDRVVALIDEDGLRPGDQLPSETELAVQLGVSRATLREALLNLEQEGVVVRRHGVGTFVAPGYGHQLESGLEVLESIDLMARRIGLETRMGEATIEERAASPDEIVGLGCEPATRVLSIQRVILVDTCPVAHLWDVVPLEYLRRVDLEPFDGSVLDVLLRRGQPPLAYSLTRLAAVAATTALAHQLHVRRNAPLLKLEARLYAQEGQVVDRSISHFVPGHFDFHVVRRIARCGE